MFTETEIKTAVDAIYEAAGREKVITEGAVTLTPAADDAEILHEDGELEDYAITTETPADFVNSGWEQVSTTGTVTELRRVREHRVWRDGSKTPRYDTTYIAPLTETHNLVWSK